MRPVRVEQTFTGTVAEAERCWLDAGGWPRWVDGCERVLSVDAGWPEPGSAVTWESGPAGRGHVIERVLEYEPLESLATEVSDSSIRGRQTVTFIPSEGEVTVELGLAYRLERASIISPLIDVLFIRRAMASSLASTLRRFGGALQGARRGPSQPA